ncbi:hypothetical protein H0H92_002579, partial [Tricholoma furcatifolium]
LLPYTLPTPTPRPHDANNDEQHLHYAPMHPSNSASSPQAPQGIMVHGIMMH